MFASTFNRAELEGLMAAAAKITADDKADEKEPWAWDWKTDADAIIEKIGWKGLAKACTYVNLDYDTEDYEGRFPKAKDAYKLPCWKLDGEKLKLYLSGAQTAMRDVCGARGGVDLDEADLKKCYRKLATYYRAFKQPIPDAPWAKKKLAGAAALTAFSATSAIGMDGAEQTIILKHPERPQLNRTIWLSDFYGTRGMYEALRALEKEDPKTDILVMIDSPGGSAYGCLSVISAMEVCACDIRTCVTEKAMSAGAYVLSAGAKGKRFAMPRATVMVHSIQMWPGYGRLTDVLNSTKEGERLNDEIIRILAENCGKDYQALHDQLMKGVEGEFDFFMSAEDAKAFKIVDEIVTSFDDIEPKSAQPEDIDLEIDDNAGDEEGNDV